MAEGRDGEGHRMAEGRDGEGQSMAGDAVSGGDATTSRLDCSHNEVINLNTSDITGGLEWWFGQMLSTCDQLQEKMMLDALNY
ncbi:unnamed protein product [Camellia sinensis]